MALEKIEELAQARTAAEYSGMLPALRVELEAQMKAIVNSVLGDIQRGELSPDKAQQKWIEYAAVVRLLQRFEARTRMYKQEIA